MSIAHAIYIPLTLIVGLALGWWLGARAAREELQRLRERAEEVERDEAAARLAQAQGRKDQ